MMDIHTKLDRLYNGKSHRAVRFNYGLLIFDVLVLAFFIIATFLDDAIWMRAVEISIALIVTMDFMVRLWIAKNRLRYILHLTTIADLVIIITLVAPIFVESLVFLRTLRALRILRSHHVLSDLRHRSRFIRSNEDIIRSVLNLSIYIFVVTALVYVFQVRVNPQISNYIDALYFTVATLTTTGFGDVTLKGTTGRLLAVGIMIFGVALFLRLAQTIFQPRKVRYKCPECGLSRHDADAVHCKHCGEVIKIETTGI